MAMSRSIVLIQLGSVLTFIAHVPIGVHANHVLNHVLMYNSYAELILDQGEKYPLTGEQTPLPLSSPGIKNQNNPGTEELAPPLVAYCIRGASWGSTGELTLPLRIKNSWQPDQPSNYPDLN